MKKLCILSCISILIIGCTPASKPTGNTKPRAEQAIVVATSFYPLTHFALQVGGEHSEVQQINAPGADPHTYEPTPQQIQQVLNADVFIFNGLGQDTWADRIAAEVEKEGVSVLIATELVDRMEYEEEHDDHDEHAHEADEHEDEHEHHEEYHEDKDHAEHNHEHGEWDPHVWLDPQRVEGIVQSIADTLAELNPLHADYYRTNARNYIAELQALDSDMQSGLANCDLNSVIVSHDAFRYLANRYNFETLEIAGLSPNAKPSPARLATLADMAKEKGIAHVFFETQVSPALSETLANEIGAETLVLHSLEALSKQEREADMNYVRIMRQNLENLRTALQCP